MANTEPITPPSGTEAPSKYLMGIEDDPDAGRFDAALEAAFGPQNVDDETPPEDDETHSESKDTDEGTEGQNRGTEPPAGASGGVEGEGGESPPEPEPSGAADFASLFRSKYGVEPTQADMEGYLALAEWAAGLSPEQQVAVNNALANPQAYTQPVGSQQPITDTPDPLVEEYGEDHPLVVRLRALENAAQQSAQVNAQHTQQATIDAINAGANAFKDKYQLSDIDMQNLQGAVANSGLFPGFVQATGNPQTAIQAALESQYWQTAEFRQRETDRQIEANKAKQDTDDKRKRKASSVSGTGGNGASREAPPPRTPEDRWAAVAAGIRDAQDNGQQS